MFGSTGDDDKNHGASPNLYTGYYGATVGLCRSLIAFDFKSFNDDYPGAEIAAVRLMLYAYASTSYGSVYAKAALQPWGGASGDWEVQEGAKTYAAADDDEPTWNSYQHNTATWNSAGADAEVAGVEGDVVGDYNGDRKSVV